MSRPAQALDQPTLYEQLMALPENLTGEIIDGELYTRPRPAGRHGEAGSALGMRIGNPFRFGDGGPGAGGFWTNRKSILSATPWLPYRIWAGRQGLRNRTWGRHTRFPPTAPGNRYRVRPAPFVTHRHPTVS